MVFVKEDDKCSFCKKSSQDVDTLFTSEFNSTIGICSSCIEDCYFYKNKDSSDDDELPNDFLLKLKKTIKSPKEIKSYLDQYIVGQDEAKIALSVSVYNHYTRIKLHFNKKSEEKNQEDIELEKSNLMLIGPTGTGKTSMIKLVAKFLDLPFAIADATSITESGYVGDDVETVLSQLLINANQNKTKAECGIVYIDEIDKIRRSSGNLSITRDVSGQGVQQALLKLVEGTIAHVPSDGSRKHPEDQGIKIDTSNILFIVGGSFTGIEEIVAKRQFAKTIGFNNLSKVDEEQIKKDAWSNISTEDIVSYGMIREFVGRFPSIAHLDPLSKEDLVRVMTEPRNSIIKQFKFIFKLHDVDLHFTDSAILAIADLAIKMETGARAIRNILEKKLRNVMFNIPGDCSIKSITINDEDIVTSPKLDVIYSNNNS